MKSENSERLDRIENILVEIVENEMKRRRAEDKRRLAAEKERKKDKRLVP
ncbi:MAG: hypothetical protein LBT89_00115 [Planctomycetaceae bacterium]|jgi:hypothetical protein|nr:hypothetical protein [Planctomycetaceae bacterium]